MSDLATLPLCISCGTGFTEWNYVTCDGCTMLVHRDCTNGYQLINRGHSDYAYIFCKECDL